MYTVAKNTKLISYALMFIGALALIFGFLNDPHRSWVSLFINNYYFLAISAFAIFFVALQYVSEAAWAISLKRIAEGITSYFLTGGIVILIIIIAGVMHMNHIWHRQSGIMDPAAENYDAIIAEKRFILTFRFSLQEQYYIS